MSRAALERMAADLHTKGPPPLGGEPASDIVLCVFVSKLARRCRAVRGVRVFDARAVLSSLR